MKPLLRFFALILCVVPSTLLADDNLTSYNDGMGAINNNAWNQMTNSRTPAVDFGNCNALVIRCAQPKCASGGCTSMDIATPIVSGCVLSNEVCKKYGDDLIQSIAAQLVASSTAKTNAANADAQKQAAQQMASQSAEQMQQMQNQMQQLQTQITEQNNQTTAAVQAALDEQKQLAEKQAAEKEKTPDTTISNAVNSGVSAEVLARDQASGQIMSKLESAQDALTALKKTMQNTFDYAGCDSSGNNCTGPKRVKVFKEKAGAFFEPYENSLDEVYDALIMAQSLGVDITDIYMMLNSSCNVWGKYLCSGNQQLRYAVCRTMDGVVFDNNSATCNCGGNNSDGTRQPPCPENVSQNGKIAPIEKGGCQLIKMLTSQEEVQQNWLYPENNTAGGGGRIEVGCASEALDNSVLFRNRKKQASIDIEVLQRIIDQDAPNIPKGTTPDEIKNDSIKYCSVGDGKDTEYLQRLASLKTLPKPVCIKDDQLGKTNKNSTKTGCEDEDNDRINSELALCSVHAYNIGEISNPNTPVNKQTMNEVIALKTTIITQQMKKQYDYLETTMKRFRTQLEKSILTSKLEAAGASSTNNSNSSSSDKNVILSDAENCRLKNSTTSAMECLQNNIRAIRYAVNNGNIGQAKKQLDKDLEVAELYQMKKSEIASCGSISATKESINGCVDNLNVKIMQILEQKQQSGQKNNFGQINSSNN